MQKKTGWTMSALVALFIGGASVTPKLLGLQAATDSMTAIGWPVDRLVLIGLIELACLVLWLIPRTALLGGIGFTALLGGAIASHLRAGSPLFSHTLFGVYLGLFMWIALWLRDERLRKLFPFAN